jgi:P-aminobenzoate N-oxygenase AurF
MLVIGEDIPDKLNRFVRRQASARLAPLIRQMITLQMVNEARHIAYARQRLDAATSGRGPIATLVYSAVLDRLFNQFIRGYFWPRAELYECAGLGEGRAWRRLAMRNPHRREFVLRLSAPTMRLLASRGITVKLR